MCLVNSSKQSCLTGKACLLASKKGFRDAALGFWDVWSLGHTGLRASSFELGWGICFCVLPATPYALKSRGRSFRPQAESLAFPLFCDCKDGVGLGVQNAFESRKHWVALVWLACFLAHAQQGQGEDAPMHPLSVSNR